MAKGLKTGGRVKGTPNRATADIRALAQEWSEQAILTLAMIGGLLDGVGSSSDAARVAALKELLDRGHGRPTQAVTADIIADIPIHTIRRVIVHQSRELPAPAGDGAA